MITVHLPGDLADKFAVPRDLELEAGTFGEMVAGLDRQYPGIRHWIVEVDGAFRPHLSVFVEGSRIDGSEGVGYRLPDGSEVWVMRAVSGG